MRDWMIKLREDTGATLLDMARRCNVSIRLMRILEEEDGITHPNIANAMALAYGMNVQQRNQLCASQHHVKCLELSPDYLEHGLKKGAPEPYVPVNVDCIRMLLKNQGMSQTGISARFAQCSTWMHECLERGTMKPSDIRRLARILDAGPEQLKATKP